MPRRRTQEEFVKQVYDSVGDEYTVIGTYKNTDTKIKFYHKACEKEFEMTPYAFLNLGRRCTHCFPPNNIKKTTEQFTKELEELRPGEFEVLEEYESAHVPILVYHKNCDRSYKIDPHSLLRGVYCRYCSKSWTPTPEEFDEMLYSLVGNEYSLLSKFVNKTTKITLKHNTCKYVWDVVPSRFLEGSRCPNCGGTLKKTHEQFLKMVYDLVGDEYVVLGHYENMSTEIKMMHTTCKTTWEVKPAHFVHSGTRCPKCCSLSKGEQAIVWFFDNHNINYTRRKTYDGLIGKKNRLSYDFHLPDYNLLIEYQGAQHERPVEYFGGEEQFEFQQWSDNQKRDYAKTHGIRLLEIWYYDFDNIEKILTKELELIA